MLLLDHDKHQSVNRRLQAWLGAVARCFNDELSSDLDCVSDLAHHVERFRGKMLRPSLVMLSAMACQPGQDDDEQPPADYVRFGAVVEMVHVATLVHDDVLDEARIRRGKATINTLRGNEAAVMLGDYLISHAYHLCSSMDKPWVAREVARATNIVCEGELLQLANRHNPGLDEATYIEIIQRKTAALTEASCAIAARLAGAPAEWVDALATYGNEVGTAFQIVDDVLDLAGDEQKVGKTLGGDVAKGKLTLPLIHHLSQCDAAGREAFVSLLADAGADRAERSATIAGALRQTQSLAYAFEHAKRRIQRAQRALKQMPDSAARQVMTEVAEKVITRDR